MKTFYLILILLLATNLQAQWSNDPNNNLMIGYGLNPELCSDSNGGCYIIYEAGYPAELFLHRIDEYGYQPWGDKRIISGELEEQMSAKIIEDGEGGVMVSYGDRILFNSFRLRVQKVDSNGNFLWGSTGVRVSVTETRQSVQRLVTDGDGGCVIVWIDTLAKYKINLINRFGQRVWSDSGKVIGVDEYYDKPQLVRASDGYYYVNIREFIYKISANGEIVRKDSVLWGHIVPDPEGGIVLSSTVWTGMIPKLVAQRKDSLGNNLWQEPYVEIADSLDINTLLKIQYNDGYYYYGWNGKKNGVDKIAQFQALMLDGNKLFPQGSVSINDYTPLAVSGIIPSYLNRMIFVWNDHISTADTTLAQIYDTLGNKLWNEDGIVVAHPAITYQSYSSDGNGGFIIGGLINDFTVVLQQVSKFGNLGEIITSVKQENSDIGPLETTLYQNFPNPFNSSTFIQFSLAKESDIKIELYNVLGERIKTIVYGPYHKGIHSFNFSSGELSSGVYLYKLQTGTKSLIKKLIIIK
jgi:hypothetical protein